MLIRQKKKRKQKYVSKCMTLGKQKHCHIKWKFYKFVSITFFSQKFTKLYAMIIIMIAVLVVVVWLL
jgi:hypothetical protein